MSEYYNQFWIYDEDYDSYLGSASYIDESGTEWWNQHGTVYHREKWWEIKFEKRKWVTEWGNPLLADDGVYVEGIRGTLPIEWYRVLDWIPVDENREITDITVQPETLAHQDGGYFDAFSIRRSLLKEKLYGPEVTHICLEELTVYDMPFTMPLFGAVRTEGAKILAVDLFPLDGTAIGIGERVQLRAINTETTGIVCTLTLMEGGDLQEGICEQFGGISETHGYISQGYGMFLEVVVPEDYDGFTIPRSLIVIQWDLWDDPT